MLEKRIIPCLDVKNGRVVKGVNFVDLVDKGDPAEHARRYAEAGADELVLLDIAATAEGRRATLDLVAAAAAAAGAVPLTVGGGIATEADVEALLEIGADKVSLGSAAVADPSLIERCARRWGPAAIVVAIDARRGGDGGWEVVTRGGTVRTGIEALAWVARAADLGAGEILLTSMDRDGALAGYDLDLLRAVRPLTTAKVIASGGAGALEHLLDAAREGASGLLAASIFHDGTFTIAEAKAFLAARGVPVRGGPRPTEAPR